MYPRIAQLRTAEQFSKHIQSIGIKLDFEAELQSAPESPLAQPYNLPTLNLQLSNRWCILPMEGWDGTTDGKPTELTIRRWERFGQSGAKFIWGGEAVAVRTEGRANPNQLVINEDNLSGLVSLRESLIRAHAIRWNTDDMLIGLQLTHSGRFSRPNDKKRMEPKILYSHPLLNKKFGLSDDYPVMSDDEIERLIDDYIVAAKHACKAGFQFVDIKHCHGYLGHEFLSAVDRDGKYGGSFENRTRFLHEIVDGIHTEVPGMEIGVRLSAFDFIPFKPDENGIGIPERLTVDGEPQTVHGQSSTVYRHAFGGDGSGLGINLSEPHQFLGQCEALGIRLINITAGSPYYVPHIQRPALFPPSDGYSPPEDPLVGVARLINATADLKSKHPNLCFIGTGYSYLQEWLPNVAQNVVRTNKADFVGLGRMVLTYPELCADVFEGKPLEKKKICRTFSDCTTAPRKGLVSGCYPLDEFYKARPEANLLKEAKQK
ncbi:MAG: NADH:flavin oxidoreductase [Chloroflexi bacterium]|nr:NADH:flavin oxidoreductase [Chloroflexota bacterium]